MKHFYIEFNRVVHGQYAAMVVVVAPSGLAALKLAEALYPHMTVHTVKEGHVV